jgi:hypothetical protein
VNPAASRRVLSWAPKERAAPGFMLFILLLRWYGQRTPVV